MLEVMDFNNILTEWRAGKLPEHSIDDLKSLSAGCVVLIQQRNPEAIHLKAAIDDEIRRKETAEFQKQADLKANERHFEAMTESRSATHYAKWSCIVAAIAAAISLGAWMLPRDSHEPNQQGAPSLSAPPQTSLSVKPAAPPYPTNSTQKSVAP